METKKFITCAEWAANAIAESGCSVVYGGHGGALVPLVDAIVSHPKLKWVYTRNEANASLMVRLHTLFAYDFQLWISPFDLAGSCPCQIYWWTGMLHCN